jgi:hypothetical protein
LRATAPDNVWPKGIIDFQLVMKAKHYSLCKRSLRQLRANKNPTISDEVF